MINVSYIGNTAHPVRITKVMKAMNKIHNEFERQYHAKFESKDIQYSVDVKDLGDLFGVVTELKPEHITICKYRPNGAMQFMARY